MHRRERYTLERVSSKGSRICFLRNEGTYEILCPHRGGMDAGQWSQSCSAWVSSWFLTIPKFIHRFEEREKIKEQDKRKKNPREHQAAWNVNRVSEILNGCITVRIDRFPHVSIETLFRSTSDWISVRFEITVKCGVFKHSYTRFSIKLHEY